MSGSEREEGNLVQKSETNISKMLMLIPALGTCALNYFLFSSFFLMKLTENVFIMNDITRVMHIGFPALV